MEESAWGRPVLSALIAVIVGIVIAFQIPNSYLRGQLMRVAAPAGNAIGLDQNWSVFAPDPRRIVIDLEARMTYADGSRSVWKVPRSDDFLGVYWDYRWLKYVEHVRLDNNRYLWAPLARYVADKKATRDDLVRVELVRRWYDLLPPGEPDGKLRGPWQEYRFYTMVVGGSNNGQGA